MNSTPPSRARLPPVKTYKTFFGLVPKVDFTNETFSAGATRRVSAAQYSLVCMAHYLSLKANTTLETVKSNAFGALLATQNQTGTWAAAKATKGPNGFILEYCKALETMASLQTSTLEEASNTFSP